MKVLATIMAIFLVFGLLTVPGVFAADDDSTDPDLSNNQASVTVDPSAEESVPMQPTGVPVLWAVLASFLILTGIISGKRS